MVSFWNLVDRKKDFECWEWLGSKQGVGYGTYVFCGASLKAHRVSWELNRGPIPKCMQVCHKCDNPGCVNPNHLFIGSHADNMRDKIEKQRANCLKGENHPLAKLNKSKVVHIRREYEKGGVTQTELAERYNINFRSIHNIVNQKSWK